MDENVHRFELSGLRGELLEREREREREREERESKKRGKRERERERERELGKRLGHSIFDRF